MSARHLIAAAGLALAATSASAGSSFSFGFGSGGSYVDLAWWNPDWYLVADYEPCPPTPVVVTYPVVTYEPVFCDPFWIDYDAYCEPAVIVSPIRRSYYDCDPWRYGYRYSYSSYRSSYYIGTTWSSYTTYSSWPVTRSYYAWDWCPTPVYYRSYHDNYRYGYSGHYAYYDDDRNRGPYSRSRYERRDEVNPVAPSRRAIPGRVTASNTQGAALDSTRPSITNPDHEPIRRALPASGGRATNPVGTAIGRANDAQPVTIAGTRTPDAGRTPVRATDPRARQPVTEARQPVNVSKPMVPKPTTASGDTTVRRPVETTTRKPIVSSTPQTPRQPVTRGILDSAREPVRRENPSSPDPRISTPTRPTQPTITRSKPSTSSPTLRDPRSTGARQPQFQPIQPRSFPSASDPRARTPQPPVRTTKPMTPTRPDVVRSPRTDTRSSAQKPTVRDYRTQSRVQSDPRANRQPTVRSQPQSSGRSTQSSSISRSADRTSGSSNRASVGRSSRGRN